MSVHAQAALPAPDPLMPAAYITNRSPEFNWTPVVGATSYEFSLGDDSDQNIYFSQDGISSGSFSIPGAVFDQAKVYHWKVRANDPTGAKSSWSAIQSFLIFDPNFVPRTIAPAGYITTTTPTFTWTSVSGAVNYDLWILNEAETVSINIVGSLDSTTYQEPPTMPFTPYTIYHYRVRARHGDGSVGIWSDPNSFMVYRSMDTPELIGPTIQAPIGGMNFSWKPVESAVSYEFVLMNEAETGSLIFETNVPLNGYAPKAGAPIEVGQVYHWKVRSVLASGGKSLWSETFSFMYFADQLVPYPLHPFGIVNNLGALVIEWSQINDAVQYDLEIRDSLSQQILFVDSISAGSSTAGGAAVPPDTKPDTKYDLRPNANRAFNIQLDRSYDWRVRATMPDGRRSVYSAPRALRVSSRLKYLQDWAGLIGESSNQFISHEEKTETIVKHTETSYENRPFGNIIRVVDTVQLQFKDTLDKVIVTVPQLKITDPQGPLRYHFVLRNSDVTGSRTIWSGDGQLTSADQVTLELPADVAVALNARATYYWVIQAFKVDGTLLGQAERQVVDNWRYDRAIGDYVPAHSYDKNFDFTSLRDIVKNVDHVSYIIVDDSTLEPARIERDKAAAAKAAILAAERKAAYDAMSPADKAAFDAAKKIAADTAAAKRSASAAAAQAAYDALSKEEKEKVDAKRAAAAAYAKMSAAEKAQYNLQMQREANTKREGLARALDAASANLQVERENNTRAFNYARNKATAIHRAATQVAETANAKAIADTDGAASMTIAENQAKANAARDIYTKEVATAKSSESKAELAAKEAITAAQSTYNSSIAKSQIDLNSKLNSAVAIYSSSIASAKETLASAQAKAQTEYLAVPATPAAVKTLANTNRANALAYANSIYNKTIADAATKKLGLITSAQTAKAKAVAEAQNLRDSIVKSANDAILAAKVTLNDKLTKALATRDSALKATSATISAANVAKNVAQSANTTSFRRALADANIELSSALAAAKEANSKANAEAQAKYNASVTAARLAYK